MDRGRGRGRSRGHGPPQGHPYARGPGGPAFAPSPYAGPPHPMMGGPPVFMQPPPFMQGPPLPPRPLPAYLSGSSAAKAEPPMQQPPQMYGMQPMPPQQGMSDPYGRPPSSSDRRRSRSRSPPSRRDSPPPSARDRHRDRDGASRKKGSSDARRAIVASWLAGPSTAFARPLFTLSPAQSCATIACLRPTSSLAAASNARAITAQTLAIASVASSLAGHHT